MGTGVAGGSSIYQKNDLIREKIYTNSHLPCFGESLRRVLVIHTFFSWL
jgi:hypothetical protein